jgi:ABC-type multidrug transport system ATPase subunit
MKTYHAGLRGCTASARALDAVHLRIDRSEVVAIVGGPSAGKTTLLLCAAGLLIPDAGSIDRAPATDASPMRAVYFKDPIHVRATDDAELWDLALIDNVDRVQGDVARAFALCSAIRRTRHHGAALLLAARDVRAVHQIADRLVVLERGRVISSTSTRRPAAVARVAERRSVDRDSGDA